MDTAAHGPPAATTFPDSWAQVLNEFEHFAKDYRQISPDTVHKHRTYLDRFHAHFQGPSPRELFPALSLRTVERFVLDYAKDHGPGSRRSMPLALRTFLRFAHHRRYLLTDLTPAVPTVRERRLAGVPKAIADPAVQGLVDAVDPTRASRRRAHAIIQLLDTYGVRGVHLRCLTLPDIDWRNGCIHFHPAKRGKRITQALTAPVGNSLLRYIRDARPADAPYDEVFLTLYKPHRPLRSSSILSSIISGALRRAHIDLPDGVSHGARGFRHLAPTRPETPAECSPKACSSRTSLSSPSRICSATEVRTAP